MRTTSTAARPIARCRTRSCWPRSRCRGSRTSAAITPSVTIGDRAVSLRDRVTTAARRLWMRYALRGVGQADNHSRLDLAYLVPDPWKLDSEAEHVRFRETSAALERAFGRPRTILEVGCGEGVQSEYFAKQCDRLTGIDVSPRAIERARRRLPAAELI